jgi:RNA polymerase sigma-B factor
MTSFIHPALTRPSRVRERETRQRLTDELMVRLHDQGQLSADDRAELIDRVILVNTPVAYRIASRFRGRGCALEDLEQTACLALVKAVNNYDPSTGYHFMSYVVPSIAGEVKRHFRDQGWMVRPPRPVQELQTQVLREQLRTDPRDGRPPSEGEIAARLDVPVAAVHEALLARGCFTPSSLDARLAHPDGITLGETLADSDAGEGYEAAEARATLAPVLGTLNADERELLRMRFVEGRTQRDIGAELGITQTHVSRRLTKLMHQLRAVLEDSESGVTAA